MYSFPKGVILGLFLQQDFVAGQNVLTLLILTFPCLPATALWAGWRRAAVPRARDPEIEALFPLSLGAYGLGPKTELFKTNDSDFHRWTMVIGGIKHQRPKNKQKNTSNKFSDSGQQQHNTDL